jgi:hypothetical protein
MLVCFFSANASMVLFQTHIYINEIIYSITRFLPPAINLPLFKYDFPFWINRPKGSYHCLQCCVKCGRLCEFSFQVVVYGNVE